MDCPAANIPIADKARREALNRTFEPEITLILAAAARPGEWMRVSVGGEAVGGDVVAVSEEVAVLRLDNGDVTYVNLAAVDEVSLASTG